MIFVAAVLQSPGRDRVFVYKVDHAVRSVSVAGTFNGWDKGAMPLKPEPDGRTWRLQVHLPYGKVQYKFVVDGSDWVLDPEAKSLPDGDGHTNSVLLVVPNDYDRPASPYDGVTAASALAHEPSIPDLNYDHGKLRFRFRARPNDLSSVRVIANGQAVQMTPAGQDDLYEYYQAYLPWNRKSDVAYKFKLTDGEVVKEFGTNGLGAEATPFHLAAKSYKPFDVPQWVEKTVVYQIFPDRFANGDTHNDPPGVQPWGAKPTYSNRFGGDVAGVEQHRGYLKDLGIGTVYFTPVFDSPSNHRYDATDYLKIAPDFGTNDEFDKLAHDLKRDGIGTVMDFAFNHTATNFWAFQDVRDKGPESIYKDWYFIKSYPVVPRENPPYVAWDNFPSMPKLNVMNPPTHQYLLDVVDHWEKSASLAGIRLDVANEVDPQLWRDVRAHLKSYAPETWIVGEEWGDASPWLGGDQWDSTMGYQFRDACLHFFAEKTTTPTEYLNRLMAVYSSYAPQVSRNLMNLLGSHDTPRFLTLCHGDKLALELAATVEFTWPGAPTIYYGDEIGMEGGVDPDNRRCMDWALANDTNPLLKYYKRLIEIRRKDSAVQSGDPAVLSENDSDRTFAFSRTYNSDFEITEVNASEKPQKISLTLTPDQVATVRKIGLLDALSGRKYSPVGTTLSIDLSPLRAVVLVPDTESNHSSFSRDSGIAGTKPFFPGHSRPIFAKEQSITHA